MANENPISRITDIHAELKEILGSDNVYFQPPETLKLKYPCIVYTLTEIREWHANNKTYKINKAYMVTLIHNNPDNDVVDKLVNTDMCKFDRAYVKDNLHHYVFTFFLRRKH